MVTLSMTDILSPSIVPAEKSIIALKESKIRLIDTYGLKKIMMLTRMFQSGYSVFFPVTYVAVFFRGRLVYPM